MKRYIFILFFTSAILFGQTEIDNKLKDTLTSQILDPLRPAKAGFYSAVLPGLGQVYNKKYWKVPLVYGAIGTSMYFYIDNKKQYNIYRDEYKNRLAGNKSNSEYLSRLSESQLMSAQKQFRRNSDLSLLCAVGFYALNIIDANVDASLSQFNVNNQLAFKPLIIKDTTLKNDLIISCIYTF
ncbi:DUF5683 domain-containing protein [Flavobacterium sp. LHD-80]|uniref:DUF5683 domain-containing protein n=1 Tax=Flavobacterium sp. LHD-80 TaxID=3071411 RepID=UPI0027E1DF5B|nr:DUF5683 domain-containing protein [Flavobacterium sp. LHD-80]MDQ6470159.1 DUF5683 domain-containing protein [Flavobacterium sp. LHD-80]